MGFMELLYEALRAEHGIKVPTPEPDRLRQKMYAERKKCEDPALDVLSFTPAPDGTAYLWIFKRRDKANGTEG